MPAASAMLRGGPSADGVRPLISRAVNTSTAIVASTAGAATPIASIPLEDTRDSVTEPLHPSRFQRRPKGMMPDRILLQMLLQRQGCGIPGGVAVLFEPTVDVRPLDSHLRGGHAQAHMRIDGPERPGRREDDEQQRRHHRANRREA